MRQLLCICAFALVLVACDTVDKTKPKPSSPIKTTGQKVLKHPGMIKFCKEHPDQCP